MANSSSVQHAERSARAARQALIRMKQDEQALQEATVQKRNADKYEQSLHHAALELCAARYKAEEEAATARAKAMDSRRALQEMRREEARRKEEEELKHNLFGSRGSDSEEDDGALSPSSAAMRAGRRAKQAHRALEAMRDGKVPCTALNACASPSHHN